MNDRWKTAAIVTGGVLAALLATRLCIAVSARFRQRKRRAVSLPREFAAENSNFEVEAIVVIPTYDRRAPASVSDLARFTARMFSRAAHPDRVCVRIPHPLALWNADHDAVCAWETGVRAAIGDEFRYHRRLGQRDGGNGNDSGGVEPFFLHANVRFERSRDIWSYERNEKRFRGTGPWWSSADEMYAYAIHPSTDPCREWDIAAVAALNEAERSTPHRVVLSPTLTGGERNDWRMTFPRVCDRGDSRGVYFRRAPFAVPTDSPQPSAALCYDDVFARTKILKRAYDAIAKRARRNEDRATYAIATGVAASQRILPHCPPRALGQSARSGFLADASVIGSLTQWRETAGRSRERWINLSCGISWLASEDEAIAKYGEARLRHWSADTGASEADQQTQETHATGPAPHPTEADTDYSTAALVPDRAKPNDALDRTMRFVPPPAKLPEGPRPIDVNLERRFESELVATALASSPNPAVGFDAPTTATGI